MRRADIEVPNLAVDMDSWARSACYPRGTFYPLSDTASTSQCRITSPSFRSCSTCLSHSQAPQLNYPSGAVPDPDHGSRLDAQFDQIGISTLTPPTLACRLHSLPHIL